MRTQRQEPTPAAPTLHGVCVAATTDLLLSLFSNNEAIRFVEEHYPEIRDNLLGAGATAKDFVDTWVHAMLRNGLIDEKFIQLLCEARPARISGIRLVLGALRNPVDRLQGHATEYLEFTFRGNLSDFDRAKLDKFLDVLRELAGGDSFTVISVKSGSVKVLISGSSDDCEKLRKTVQLLGAEMFEELISASVGLDSIGSDLNPSPDSTDLHRLIFGTRYRDRLRAHTALLSHFLDIHGEQNVDTPVEHIRTEGELDLKTLREVIRARLEANAHKAH